MIQESTLYLITAFAGCSITAYRATTCSCTASGDDRHDLNIAIAAMEKMRIMTLKAGPAPHRAMNILFEHVGPQGREYLPERIQLVCQASVRHASSRWLRIQAAAVWDSQSREARLDRKDMPFVLTSDRELEAFNDISSSLPRTRCYAIAREVARALFFDECLSLKCS